MRQHRAGHVVAQVAGDRYEPHGCGLHGRGQRGLEVRLHDHAECSGPQRAPHVVSERGLRHHDHGGIRERLAGLLDPDGRVAAPEVDPDDYHA